VDFSETANTDGLAHVDVAGDGSGADVEPEITHQKNAQKCRFIRMVAIFRRPGSH